MTPWLKWKLTILDSVFSPENVSAEPSETKDENKYAHVCILLEYSFFYIHIILIRSVCQSTNVCEKTESTEKRFVYLKTLTIWRPRIIYIVHKSAVLSSQGTHFSSTRRISQCMLCKRNDFYILKQCLKTLFGYKAKGSCVELSATYGL